MTNQAILLPILHFQLVFILFWLVPLSCLACPLLSSLEQKSHQLQENEKDDIDLLLTTLQRPVSITTSQIKLLHMKGGLCLKPTLNFEVVDHILITILLLLFLLPQAQSKYTWNYWVNRSMFVRMYVHRWLYILLFISLFNLILLYCLYSMKDKLSFHCATLCCWIPSLVHGQPWDIVYTQYIQKHVYAQYVCINSKSTCIWKMKKG